MFGCQETHLSCKSNEKPRILEKIHHLWQPRNPPVEVLQVQEKIGKKKKMPKVFSRLAEVAYGVAIASLVPNSARNCKQVPPKPKLPPKHLSLFSLVRVEPSKRNNDKKLRRFGSIYTRKSQIRAP